MAKFRYVARESNGQRVGGELDARSRDDAEHWLREWGLEPLEVTPADEPVEAAIVGPLSPTQAQEVAEQLSRVAGSGLPLVAGLKAAAAEASSRRIARALRLMAADIERGSSLESVLQQRASLLPEHLRGLMLSAARTGHLNSALDEFMEHERSMREIVWSVVGAVAYPLVVLALALLLLLALPLLVVPEFKRMFVEFELQLPWLTQVLISFSDLTIWLATRFSLRMLLLLVFVGLGIWYGVPGLLSAPMARRILYEAPVIGRFWQWSGMAAFSRLLAVLLESGVPLPEALRLTAGGLTDQYLRYLCEDLSIGIDQGRRLSDLLDTSPGIPASVVPWVRWGEKTGELADALRTASTVFVERIRLRALLLRSVSPPVVFVVVLLVVSMMIVSLFMPLVSLIQGLS